MKIKNWLVVSFVANAALIAVVIWLVVFPPGGKTAASAPKQPMTDNNPSSATRGVSIRSAPIGSDEWASTMGQLRCAGVPGAIIAKVVLEAVAQKWTPLEAEHERQYLNGDIDAKQLAGKHDERAQEEERELRAALGDGFVEWDREHTVQTMYLGGHQPTEEQKESLYVLQKSWLRHLRELEVANRNGLLSDAGLEAERAKGEAEFNLKLVGIIGAERVDSVASIEDAAQQVRREFSRLPLTDTQISQLADVQIQWEKARGEMAAFLAQTKTMDAAYEGDLKALDRARDDDYRRILGEQSFDAWQKAGDERYRLLRNNAQAWGLDSKQIDHVYATIRAYDLAAATLEHQSQVREQMGEPVDWRTLEDSLADYTRQTAADLRAFLGEERFTAMARQQIFGLRQSARLPHASAK